MTRLEQQLTGKPWQEARQGVQVKLLAEEGELYVFAQSEDRIAKERAMRRRQMKWLWKRLRQLAAMDVSREEMLMKLTLPPQPPPKISGTAAKQTLCSEDLIA